MALRFLESFDAYGDDAPDQTTLIERMGGKWDHLWPSGGSDFQIVEGAYSGKGIKFGGNYSSLSKHLDDQQEWYVGMFLKVISAYHYGSDLLYITDHTSTQASLKVLGPGSGDNERKILVYTAGTSRGFSATVLEADRWYFVEFYVKVQNDTNGVYELRINGATEVSGNADTSSTGNNYASGIRFVTRFNTWNLDDIYVLDGQEGLSEFLGASKVSVLYPEGDGTPQLWTPSSGVDHYALLDDRARDTDDYVITDVAGSEDMFDFPAPGYLTIKGVQLCVEAGTTGTEIEHVGGIIRVSANDVTASKHVYGGPSLPGVILVPSEYVPGTTDQWTAADIDAASFGIEKVD